MSTFEAVRPLQPGRPVEIIEKNDNGNVIGSWFGYWNFQRGTVAMYPNVTNHKVNWPNGRIPKERIVVSDRSVKCRVQSTEGKAQSSECKAQSSESRAQRKEPLMGQEKIKL